MNGLSLIHISDEEFEEDSDYIDNIIKKGSEYKQEQIKNAIVESSKPRFSEAERRIEMCIRDSSLRCSNLHTPLRGEQ